MGKENAAELSCHHLLEGKTCRLFSLSFLLLWRKQQALHLEQAPVSMTSLALSLESFKSGGQEAW